MRGGSGVLAVLWLVGCGETSSPPPGPPGVEAIFTAPNESALTPFPSDRYTTPDGATKTGRRLALGASGSSDLLLTGTAVSSLAELDQLDGFSINGGAFATFSGPIDDASALERGGVPLAAEDYATPDAPVLLVDVDPASPERGVARPLIPLVFEQADDGWYDPEFTLLAQPATPLRPRTRYLFVATDALRAEDGGPVKRSALTEELLGGALGDDYAASVAEALDELEGSVGLGREHVVLASVFTTMTVHDELVAVAEHARAQPPPALLESWTIETPTQADGRARLRAVFESPEYRAPLPDGTWKPDAQGLAQPQAQAGLEVFLAVSDAQTPTKRIPVIYQHGLGGDKDGCWGTSERLAPLNAAVFAIDSPYHGSRADGGTAATAIFRFFGIDLDGTTFVMGRARDNFRQLSADQLELVRFIRSLETLDVLPPGAPDGVPDLDTSRILYIGHSFGSVQGATVFAFAPEIKQAVWNVGGAGLTTLLRDSDTFGLLVDTFKPDGVSDGGIARFLAATQAIIDPGDPLSFARFGAIEPLPGVALWAPRDVLIQEVVADNIVPNSTSEALARAAGLALVSPISPIPGLPVASAPLVGNLPGGATGALCPFDVMNGGETAQHGELIFSPEAIAQYLAFFESGLADGHATIEPPY